MSQNYAPPIAGAPPLHARTHGDEDHTTLATPACRVYKAAAQSITSATPTALTFDTERYDDPTNPMHDTSTNNTRITVRVAGVYNVGCTIAWTPNATGERQTAIKLNGSNRIAQQAFPGSLTGVNQCQSPSTDWNCVVGDYFEVHVAQDSGAPLNVERNADYSPEFWAHRVR